MYGAIAITERNSCGARNAHSRAMRPPSEMPITTGGDRIRAAISMTGSARRCGVSGSPGYGVLPNPGRSTPRYSAKSMGGQHAAKACEGRRIKAEHETRSVVLPPEAAYGPIRPEAFREFPLEGIPEQARRVGRKVVGRAPDGSEDLFDIVEIRDATAVIDMNHPLAGRTLRFELRVLKRDS